MVKTREYSEEERLKMYEMRCKDKLSLRSIGNVFGCTGAAVKYIVDKINAFGTAKNLTKSGRKRCTTVRTDSLITRLVTNNRKLKRFEIRDLLPQEYRIISLKTITNRLKEFKFRNSFAANKPMVSPQNRVKRLAFAKQYISMPLSFWRKVLWSDESKFELIHSKRRVMCWKKKGEGLIPQTTNP